MKKKDVNFVKVPHFEELAVKKLWRDLKSDTAFNIYFQNSFPDERGPCRKYFFDIINTIYPEYVSQIMSHASKQRYGDEAMAAENQTIQATPEWYDALQNQPFRSGKHDSLLH